MPKSQTVVVWIKLEIEGPDARANARDLVEVLLDHGTPQDSINDAGYDMTVKNATVEAD